MKQVSILFPHQLSEWLPMLNRSVPVYLVEEYLFFRQYHFHKQKLAFHRASMRFYYDWLRNSGYKVVYVHSYEKHSEVQMLVDTLKQQGIEKIHYTDPTDDWLKRRLTKASLAASVFLEEYPSPLFINSKADLERYFAKKKTYFQTDFYTWQRKERCILIDGQGRPVGGKWTFDADNRLRYPKGKQPPSVALPDTNIYYNEALEYVNSHFPNAPGTLQAEQRYPCTFEEAQRWLHDFLYTRFAEFGSYEDAILEKESILHHSLLTPLLNSGLLNPLQVLDIAVDHAASYNIPLNTLEGFVRQILGWREFIRAVYEREGRKQRTLNFWHFNRKIPATFYNGSTGIVPVDATIRKVLDTGYCHHIERLMVLGNFMLLCEFDPNEVYRWFMELFIDAYDWVMVPNVYGMSQFADGGMMCTKPYISGSNYLFKMSDYKKGDWSEVWDALFWRFMHTHRSFFLQNPRLGMLVHTFDKMPPTKQEQLLFTAENYLKSL